MKKVYLAGPDVFASDAAERAEQHKSLCRMHGFEPLHPVDQVEPTAQSIYQHNVELIQQADAVIANAKPFRGDRKSTRLNSSHVAISYAVFCLKKKTQH